MRLPFGKTFAYGLQHVLTMYGGIIAPPLIIGNAAGMAPDEVGLLVACCLFVGGLATILQTIGIPFFGAQLPLVQGTSFASVATMVAIVNGSGGIQAVFGAVLAAALIGFLIAPFFARIIRFFPPVVTGVVITMIGISLTPVAANWAMGGDAAAPDYGSLANIGLAAGTLLVVLLLSKVGNAAISRMSILLAIVFGTVAAALLGMADFSQVGHGAIFAFPQPLAFGMPVFEIGGIISMTIVVLVILTETTADILAVGEIAGSKVDSKRIANGLRADMASSAVAPIFNTFTQSAFAQNVGLVAITGITSRFVVAAGGGILVVLGLLPILGRVVAAIPTPVLGGAGIVLFGTVAASGIRTLSKVKYDGMNLVIVAASIAFGCIPIVKPDFYAGFPTWFETIFHSGISSAAVMAVLLNLLFNEFQFGNTKNSSVFSAAPPRMVKTEEICGLLEGDHYVGGKLIDKEGYEIPVVTPDEFEKIQTGAIQMPVPKPTNLSGH
ncbi:MULTISPECIES: nucleobase:cation symporter-2 family protein [Glutamicibacter]|uniref:Purine permease n=2 Tax=Glutamicibacter arilaitensis TaxID=256701 RepID=A0A4Y8U1P3_9MICC|nr:MULTISPECIES: nucleobase:cation symporter-2 family protein [Glutamicibacter]TFH57681.1 purine permease [Glutamicibacter arilaitensis]CBT77559.1 putative xanthine/uric acid permease [Glutamicibacter arilaitensis Re117]HCH46785.1 purine permease [Glutamicibacter sp.]HCJ53081.1 purine permease [Glutamicibacter sp.]